MELKGIQLALIASVSDTRRFCPMGDIELAFAHLCLSFPDYASYFATAAKSGRTVILDNGVMELDSTLDDVTLAEVTKMIKPGFVTPPEVLGNGAATLAMTRDFIRRREELLLPEETRFLGVVHGGTWGEWFEQYKTFHDDLDQVARIGIPYDITFEVPGVKRDGQFTDWQLMLVNRIRIVELLNEAGLNKKPAHLLGSVDAIELCAQTRFPWIVSNDSSTCYVSARHGEQYNPDDGINARKVKIDMMDSMPECRVELFYRNLVIIRGFALRPAGSASQ